MSAAAQLISTNNAANVVVGSNNITNSNLSTATTPSAIPTAKRPLTVISESAATDNNNANNSQSNNVNSNNIVPSVTLNRVSCFLFFINFI
jgi:hypothetical protein